VSFDPDLIDELAQVFAAAAAYEFLSKRPEQSMDAGSKSSVLKRHQDKSSSRTMSDDRNFERRCGNPSSGKEGNGVADTLLHKTCELNCYE